MRTRPIASLFIVAAVATFAAQGQPAQPTFRAGANYVRVDMYATQDGQPINDVRADEIEVLEDGVPQKLEDFEHVLVRPATAGQAGREPDGVRDSREAAADPRARVFIIFLDTYHTRLEGSASIRQPLVRFLDRVLGPDDLVALMTPEMGASDIALGRKTTVIADILQDEWWGRRARITQEDPKETLYRACMAGMAIDDRGKSIGAFESRAETLIEELIARRREKLTLDALEDLLVHLSGLRDERKGVVVITEGWKLYRENPKLAAINPERGPARPPILRPPVPPPSEAGSLNQPMQIECEADRNALALVDHDEKMRRMTEDANRGNVTFYPVHPRGLVAFDSSIEENVSLAQDSANLRTRLDSMRALAIDTDGEAIINTNNIEGTLKRIADDLSSYYLFGYYSTNSKLDGRFRSITVRVKRPGVRVRARRGYRGRTAEEVLAAAGAAPDPVRDAVASALNVVAGVNARSSFRVRPAAWSRDTGGAVAGTMWLVGELDYRTRKELAWTAGAQAEISVVASDGTVVTTKTVDIPANEGSFGIQVPDTGTLGAGDYAVSVRLRPEAGSDVVMSDTVRVVVPQKASPLGEAVMWRRGPSTGIQFLRTADPRFQRSERVKLELAAAPGTSAAARLLDRAGKPLQVPVRVSERTDAASGQRWIVAEATLAPLAPGDYAIEVAAGESQQLTGFRITP
jgi:VWFA-related protein